MSVSLKKGQKISLTKDNLGLSRVVVGLGWDESTQPKKGFFGLGATQSIDCDAAVIMLKNGKLCSNTDLIYFGHLKHSSGGVQHMGDNLTGAGEGDDEQVIVDFSRIPADYDRLVVVVNIFMCMERKQNFGMIKNAFIRLVDDRNNTEMCRYNLTDDYSGMTSMIFGELYKNNGEWKFNAMGQGTTDPGLKELARRFQ